MTTLSITTGEIPQIPINTAHSIQRKTSQCLQLLYPDVSVESATPLSVIALVAKSAAASKVITTIEIIKRRMVEQGDHWYQYSALSSVIIEMTQREDSIKNKQGQQSRGDRKRHMRDNTRDKGKKAEVRKEEIGQGEGEEEEDPFESIGEKTQSVRKKVPSLTIYISKSPILELARLYG